MDDTMPQIRVLLVDDEADFREPVARFLGKAGMDVVGVGAVEDMAPVMEGWRPDVIVLDVNLPGESGMEAVQRLRAHTAAGLVMVTARGGIDDRIRGLSLGADSYLGKPVNMRELEAVIRSLWSRVMPTPSAAPPAERPPERAWVFDTDRWVLTSPDGEEARLSAAEHSVLMALTQQPGQAVPRDALFDALGKRSAGPEDRSLDVLVSRLRRKYHASTITLPVRSVRGIGYVFPMPVTRRP